MSQTGQDRTASISTEQPFMQPLEIEAFTILLRAINRPIKALEWGTGHSTLYYASRLPFGSSWDSVEHDPAWAEAVQQQITTAGLSDIKVHIRLSDAEYIHGEDDGSFSNFRRYILFPSSFNTRFDLILVDGRARCECMAVGWDLLAPYGVMILHDAARMEYQQALPETCRFVRVTAHDLDQYGGRPSILFMAKQASPLYELLRQLKRTNIRQAWIEHNLGSLPAPAGKVLFVNTYYSGFLKEHYQRHPGMEKQPYWQQKRSLLEQCFGDSDFYSAGMRVAGWDADDLIINVEPLQLTWAAEQGLPQQDMASILLAQLEQFAPDVVYIQDLSIATTDMLARIRQRRVALIAGQIASPLPPQTDLDGIDLLFSSFPHFVEQFRSQGKAAWYQPLAFEPRILQRLPVMPRSLPVTFVGGLSPHHGKGIEQLSAIAAQEPFGVWGYGADHLAADSTLRERHHGEVWGLDMFGVLRQSAITLNRHIDVAADYANNMRLFEATGCGALLITDYRSNLHELFEIGSEVVAYRSPEEAVALIRYYLAHPDEAAAIAAAGQQRTLRDHTYTNRMAHTAEILERHLRYRREQGKYPLPNLISTNYRLIEPSETTDAMVRAWQDESIPARQRGLVQLELEQMYAGQVRPHFLALTDLLRPFVHDGYTILELGCASGYYYEILEYLLGRRINFTGVDYSDAMVDMARECYPRPQFFAADAKSLFFADRQFDVVISSCVLLHVPNFRQHIEETCRVAKDLIVVHRTPIYLKGPTRTMAKQAYGVETVELCFNEAELLDEFARHQFHRSASIVIHANPEQDEYGISYLLRRKS